MRRDGWSKTTLGELTQNFDALRVPVKFFDRTPGPFPYYGASGIIDYVDGYIFDGEYLLIAEDGENLRTRKTPIAFMASGQFWVNNHAHVVRANDKSDTKFLMYALAAMDISGYLTGSTQPKLTQDNLNRVRLSVPPVDEQRAIAQLLGAIDDKIELNRRMNETLKATARAVFKSWFVDQVSREEEREGSPPQSSAAVLKDLAGFKRILLDPQAFPDELFDHYSIPAFDDGGVPAIERGADIRSSKFEVSDSNVLVSKLNPRIPRVWVPLPKGSRRSICSTEFVVMEPGANTSKEFLFCLLTTEEFGATLATLATGTSGSHQRVKAEALVSLPVPKPQQRLVDRFTQLARPMLRLVAQNLIENRALAALRDVLLPKLISGEIRVRESAEMVT